MAPEMGLPSPQQQTQLPPDLQTLADFLGSDDRPAAIFHASAIPGGRGFENALELPIAWSNPAFHAASDLRDLCAALHATASAKPDRWHGLRLVGKRWQTRVAGEYCIATASNSSASVRADSLIADNEPLPPEAEGVEGKARIDWLGEEPPNVSPWFKFIRDFDWPATPLGPRQQWPPLLKHYVLSMMANPNPRLLVWDDAMTFIYNEACVPLWGVKHPECLGQSVKIIFAEAWDTIKNVVEDAYRGKVTRIDRFELPIQRQGFLEESYWDFTLLPVFDERGVVVGSYNELTESTAFVMSERRSGEVNKLSDLVRSAHTLDELWPAVLQSVENSPEVPFAMLYTVMDDTSESDESSESKSSASSSTPLPKKCILNGSVRLPEDYPQVNSFSLVENCEETDAGIIQPCLKAWKTRDWVILSSQDGTLPPALASSVARSKYGTPIRAGIVSPIVSMNGMDVLAILIFGVNPSFPFNSEYELFCKVAIEMIEKNAALIALPDEKQRAQKFSDTINDALIQQLRVTTLKAEKSEAKFARLAGAAPTGMFMFDVDGRELYVNDTYLEMLGMTREEHAKRPAGTFWTEEIHEDDLERFSNIWQKVVIDKSPITVEYRMKKPWHSIDKSSGQEISGETWLLATAFPEVEADGTVSAIQGWLTDISHRKFSENVLSSRLQDALENKRQTENFIDMTSHEMRNPLSAILQSADSIVTAMSSVGMPLLGEDITMDVDMAEDILDAAQTIILCAQHQKRIVDDILTLSKLDASLLVISPDRVQIPALITKALKMYEAEIERADIEAQLCIEPTYAELEVDWVILDPSRLLQVIINLLTNAIKFTQYAETKKVKICLGASRQKPTGKHHGITFIPPRNVREARTPRPDLEPFEDIYLQIAVYDTGRGMNEDEMKSLFQRFQQASPKTYEQYGGSGLGLFISRELCELQGGQIGVASGGGKTVFTFFVKAKKWTEKTSTTTTTTPGLTRFSSAAASPMAYDRRGSTAMSESGQGDQMSRKRSESGSIVEDFHPASRKLSLQPPSEARSKPKPPKPTTSPSPNASPEHQMHVLIVEDNTINQKVMSQQLRRAGCVVHVANHGVECLDFLEQSHFCSTSVPLSIILLDLEMPTMDGLTCIRHIRERQKSGKLNSHVPVIAVTANARSEQISGAIDAGMDQVVTKPFRIPELVPQMESLIAAFATGKAAGG